MSGTDQKPSPSCCAEPCTFCSNVSTEQTSTEPVRCTEYNCTGTDCDCADCNCTDCGCSNCDGSEDKSVDSGPTKIYYTYNDIHELIENHASELTDCGYDYIVAIGGGGFIPARMLRTFVNVPIIAVTIKFYDENDHITSEPEVIQWGSEAIDVLRGKKCLIVDEVYDTGSTMKYVVDRLYDEGVTDLSVMVLHHKIKDSNKDNTSHIVKKLQNFHPLIEVADEWIVYPWDADDIKSHNDLASKRV